ncbi:MAG: cephalosporin hydroxylase family protein [Actinomycetota bacterium]|nr:cephalosporin hydroxylase family protein [Actinomycetota bacterium]
MIEPKAADPIDDRVEFELRKRSLATAMAGDRDLATRAVGVSVDADRYLYSYQWSWLGLPIIQMPPDILVTQEIIWACRPQLVIETGVARGGSVILSASLLQLLGEGGVVAIDIDIRPHNRAAIEQHPLAQRVELIQGSSIDPAVVEQVRARAKGVDRVMVMLDSSHTHDHVLAELEAYAPLVSNGQFLVVADTAIEFIPAQEHRPRPWGPGNNPMTALRAYLADHPDFEPDEYLNAKTLYTSSPGGYLRRRAPVGPGSHDG